MSLRATVLLVLCVALMGLVTLLTAASWVILGDSFDVLEARLAQRNLDRAEAAFQAKLHALDSLVKDWAFWDDTYAFVEERDEEFIRENIIYETFEEQRLNCIAVLDAEGRPIYAAGAELADAAPGELTPPPAGLLPYFAPGGLLHPGLRDTAAADDAKVFHEDELGRGVRGLLLLEQGALLVAARPILTSARQGPARGILAMGRFIDDAVLESFAVRLAMPVVGRRPDRALPTEVGVMLGEGASRWLTPEDDVLRGFLVLEDILGEPGYLLELRMDREVHAQGMKTLRHVALAVAIACALFSMAVLGFMHRKVLRRVRSLTVQLEAISRRLPLAPGEAPPSRVRLEGEDELAGLAAGINALMDAKERANEGRREELEARKASEHFLEQVFDAIHAGIVVVHPETRCIIDINNFALRLAGRSREELVGERCHALICPAEEHECPVLDKGEQVDLSVRSLLGLNGGEIPILKSVTEIQRGGETLLLETFIDITEFKEAEEALRASEGMYRAIFENTGAASLIVDAAGVVTMVNEEFAALVGMEPRAIELRRIWTDLFPSEDARILRAMQAKADSERMRQQAELVVRDAAGNSRQMRALVAKIPGPHVWVVSLQDYTEQKVVEAELRRTHQNLEHTVTARTKELQKAVEELRELDKLKTYFLSSASHELRTPLTAVLGYAKLLRKGLKRRLAPYLNRDERLQRFAEEADANFEIIQREGERLTQLINDLLDLNAIESGEMPWEDTRFDPVEALEEAAANARPVFAQRPDVTLEREFPDRLPELHMDRARLLQLVGNLLDNAAKFTTRGAVTLAASVVKPGVLEIQVRDTGVGVSPDEQDAVFGRFYQTQTVDNLSEKPLGTGLGLAICRRIVERYQGRIWVESAPGEGSVFFVQLPLAG